MFKSIGRASWVTYIIRLDIDKPLLICRGDHSCAGASEGQAEYRVQEMHESIRLIEIK